jgi:hypothetical protein
MGQSWALVAYVIGPIYGVRRDGLGNELRDVVGLCIVSHMGTRPTKGNTMNTTFVIDGTEYEIDSDNPLVCHTTVDGRFPYITYQMKSSRSQFLISFSNGFGTVCASFIDAPQKLQRIGFAKWRNIIQQNADVVTALTGWEVR